MNNDLISREALRKDIEHLHSVYVDNKDWFYTDVLNHIDNAPAVEQRPQGKWIVIFDEDNVKTCKCSICGRIEDIVDFDKYPYCHCGAKMKYDTKQ